MTNPITPWERIQIMKKTLTKMLGILICSMLLITSIGVAPSKADETKNADTRSVTGQFSAFGKIITWEYPYSDEYFLVPSGHYDHNFAKLSLGLALSSFRHKENPDAQDDHLIAFFEGMGFRDIETDTYRKEPEPDSISYGLASKKIGDLTVLACAVCGGNYTAEWASNLTVGNEDRSEGFHDASRKVQAAIKDYLERHPFDGAVKLWITGYSRAAATSNITAADLIPSGLFEDVYAYTFATPCTTRQPSPYPNIFNIMQKDDPVPKVPLTDWDYGHYGTDLYFVSPETDSDCAAIMENASRIYQEITGAQMVSNAEINYQLRIILDYLLMILPDPGVYKEYLQPLILDIMTSSDETKEALLVLLEALERYSVDKKEHGEELKAMREYLETMVNVYYLKGTLNKWPADMWDPQFGVANLFHAHFPFEYLAMMYASDEPAALFSENTDYIRLVIYGRVDAEILDEGKTLKTILADGTELVDGKSDTYSFPDVICSKEKMVITLPADKNIKVKVTSRAALPQTITYTGLLFSGHTVRASADDLYSYFMNNGDEAIITTSSTGKAIEPLESDYLEVSSVLETIYSPTTAMRLENNSVMHLTISGLVNKLLFILVFLLIQMIVSIILAIIRVKKKRKRNKVAAFIWHFIMAAIFAILEVAMWYFVPILTLGRFIPAVVVLLVIAVYAWKGYRYHKKGLGKCFILTGVLILYEILTSLLIGEFTFNKGLVELIAYAVFMVLAYLLMWKDKATFKAQSSPQ